MLGPWWREAVDRCCAGRCPSRTTTARTEAGKATKARYRGTGCGPDRTRRADSWRTSSRHGTV